MKTKANTSENEINKLCKKIGNINPILELQTNDDHKNVFDEIAERNTLNVISFEDTIPLMSSECYKERFLAEYVQLKNRYNKLHKIMIEYDAGTLNIDDQLYISNELTKTLLEDQLYYMGNYLRILETRAQIENITLPTYI